MHLTDEQLMARTRGPLGPEVEAHLAACPQCRAAAAETLAVWRHFPDERIEPTPSFDARLRMRLDAEDERRSSAGWFDWAWAAPSLAAVAGVALILAGPSAPAPTGPPIEMLAELEMLDDLEAAELVDVYADLEVIEDLGEEGG